MDCSFRIFHHNAAIKPVPCILELKMSKSPQQMTTILLTGATGTLGSKILFSLMEQRFDSIEKIILPVRKKAAISPERRIQNMRE